MPRASRYILPGQTVHLTQRCHGRDFLLRFAVDRNRYREMLRERLEQHRLYLFNYCITSNHVHLLLRDQQAGAQSAIPAFMNSLAGDFAQYYNLRKGRSGAYWGDRYHASMIDSGEYLFRCMVYIDLNMVRAGVVEHPSDWNWTGYAELLGLRKRYCLINRKALLKYLHSDACSFAENYQRVIDEKLRAGRLQREPLWSESLAVGRQQWSEQLAQRIENRIQVEVGHAYGQSQGGNTWIVKEPPTAYS